MSKFIGEDDHEGSLVGPGEDGWIRLAVIVVDEAMERVLEVLKPLVKRKVVHLANAQRTPDGKKPVLLLFAAEEDAVRKVMKAVGGMAKVKRLS